MQTDPIEIKKEEPSPADNAANIDNIVEQAIGYFNKDFPAKPADNSDLLAEIASLKNKLNKANN